MRRGRYKVAVCGAPNVGKSSLVQRLLACTPKKEYTPSIGPDVFFRTVELPSGQPIVLELWDVAPNITSQWQLDMACYGADAVVFVYDMTDRGSFDCMAAAVGVTLYQAGDDADPWVAIVGNKADRHAESVVDTGEAIETCQLYGFTFMETSCLEPDTTQLLLDVMCAKLPSRRQQQNEAWALNKTSDGESTM